MSKYSQPRIWNEKQFSFVMEITLKFPLKQLQNHLYNVIHRDRNFNQLLNLVILVKTAT